MSLIKSKLIQNITEANPHLFVRDVERIVNTIFNEITQSLAEGKRVELRGFGAFSVQHRKQFTVLLIQVVLMMQIELLMKFHLILAESN